MTSGVSAPHRPTGQRGRRGALGVAVHEIATTTRDLGGPVVAAAAAVGLAVAVLRTPRSRGRSLLPLALLGAALGYPARRLSGLYRKDALMGSTVAHDTDRSLTPLEPPVSTPPSTMLFAAQNAAPSMEAGTA